MPNFIAQKIKNLAFPFEKDDFKFEFLAKNDKLSLVLVKTQNEAFFLQIKKQNDSFIIKGDKHSKPSKIGLLQKALSIFESEFCEVILSKSYALKKTTLIKEDKIIINDFENLLKNIKNANEIYIEIGFGSGRHLLFQAAQNPSVLIIGLEIYSPALTQVAKLARARDLENIILMQSDARLFLSVLPDFCVDRIFLHFPVPWPKKEHRRVISSAFCKECARVLKSNGKFELRSDDLEYFNFTLNKFLELKSVKFQALKNENLGVSSKYEDRWKRQQKDIFDLIAYDFKNDLSFMEKNDKFNLEKIKLNKEEFDFIKANLSLKKFKKDDFFLNIDLIFECENALLLKLAFGAFTQPNHAYLRLDEKLSFVLNEPFKTKENLKAINFFVEFLSSFSKDKKCQI